MKEIILGPWTLANAGGRGGDRVSFLGEPYHVVHPPVEKNNCRSGRGSMGER